MMVEVLAEWGQPATLDEACRQAEAAKIAGCAWSKWQMFDPDRLVSNQAKRYWAPELGGSQSQRATFTDNGTLDRDDWRKLRRFCDLIGIGFLVTPFDLEAVEQLAELEVEAVKIASADVTYQPLVQAVGRLRVPVFISAGASEVSEVYRALRWIGHPHTIVLACDLVYPCPAEHANLLGVQEWAHRRCGYSDHTVEVVTGAVAVALGATVLEKHTTINPDGVAPDNRMALTPDKLHQYVTLANDAARLVTPVTGDPQRAAREQARRAWHAARDLPAGHVLADGDVIGLRPCTPGMVPVGEVVSGRTLGAAVKRGEAIPA